MRSYKNWQSHILHTQSMTIYALRLINRTTFTWGCDQMEEPDLFDHCISFLHQLSSSAFLISFPSTSPFTPATMLRHFSISFFLMLLFHHRLSPSFSRKLPCKDISWPTRFVQWNGLARLHTLKGSRARCKNGGINIRPKQIHLLCYNKQHETERIPLVDLYQFRKVCGDGKAAFCETKTRCKACFFFWWLSRIFRDGIPEFVQQHMAQLWAFGRVIA